MALVSNSESALGPAKTSEHGELLAPPVFEKKLQIEHNNLF